MVDAVEHLHEGALDAVDVAQRQVAIVELPALHPVVDHLLDQLLQLAPPALPALGLRGGRPVRAAPPGAARFVPEIELARVRRGPHRRFDRIGQHDHPGLLGLWPGAGIAEVLLAHLVAALQRPVVEVADQHRAVVLPDDVDDRLGQARLAREAHAVGDVVDDDPRALLRIEHIVDVVAVGLVLDEEGRAQRLADVVVEHRHPREERVAADQFDRALSQVRDDDAVVIGAGRLARQLVEERLVGVRQLQQLQMGGDAEEPPQEAERPEGQHGRQPAVERRHDRDLRQAHGVERAGGQAETGADREDRQSDPHAGPEEVGDAVGPPEEEGPDDRGDEGQRGVLERVGPAPQTQQTERERADQRDRRGERQIEQHGGQHRRGGDREGVDPGRVAAERQAGRDDRQGDRQPQQDKLPAAPDRAVEPVEIGHQQEHQDRDQPEDTEQRRPVDPRPQQPELLQLLAVRAGDRLALADDRLPFLHRHRDRLHGPARLLALLLGQFEILGHVGLDEIAGHGEGQRALARVERRVDAAAQPLPDVLQVVRPHLPAHRVVEQPAGGPRNRRPARPVEQEHLPGLFVRQAVDLPLHRLDPRVLGQLLQVADIRELVQGRLEFGPLARGNVGVAREDAVLRGVLHLVAPVLRPHVADVDEAARRGEGAVGHGADRQIGVVDRGPGRHRPAEGQQQEEAEEQQPRELADRVALGGDRAPQPLGTARGGRTLPSAVAVPVAVAVPIPIGRGRPAALEHRWLLPLRVHHAVTRTLYRWLRPVHRR